MKKSLKNFTTVTLASLLMLSSSLGVFASEPVNILQDTPPQEEALIVPYGASKPKSSASTHDLSISNYEYQVHEVGAAVYTDKWLTGVDSIKISVENWTILAYSNTSQCYSLTVSVYDSSDKLVASKGITIDSRSLTGSATLTGLTSSSKYYVRFSVSTNGNKYKFNGTIASN